MKRFLLVLAGVAALACAGCESEKPSESRLPQAQQQSWEQTLPGFGGQGTGVR